MLSSIQKKKYNVLRATHLTNMSGMTVIELTVVISIFAIISTVVLARFSDFSSNISLQNLAQDIALRVKQAQYSATSGVYPKVALGQQVPLANWTPSYGLYFEKNKNSFSYFFDRESNLKLGDPDYAYRYVYNDPLNSFSCGSGKSECLDTISITTGEEIKDICVGSVSTSTCGNPAVSLTFTRPLPDMTANNNRGGGILITYPDTIYIIIGNSAQTSKQKIISITPLGQISTQ